MPLMPALPKKIKFKGLLFFWIPRVEFPDSLRHPGVLDYYVLNNVFRHLCTSLVRYRPLQSIQCHQVTGYSFSSTIGTEGKKKSSFSLLLQSQELKNSQTFPPILLFYLGQRTNRTSSCLKTPLGWKIDTKAWWEGEGSQLALRMAQ